MSKQLLFALAVMPTRMLLVLAIVSGAARAQNALDYSSVWKCDIEKFNWYCDMDEAPRKARPPAQPAKHMDLKDLKTAEQLRRELKRREDAAVMNPTDRNLKDYLALWQVTQQKGAVFADNWRRVVWQNPDLDYSLKRPVNNAAIKLYDESRLQNEEQQLRLLARDHGLIFFFRSDCPYCHAMAPAVKMLAVRYGIDVLGVSVDGRGLPEFPNPRDGRAYVAIWGVERVPALFIASKETRDRAPVGFGMMAFSEIVRRIFVLTGTKPGDDF